MYDEAVNSCKLVRYYISFVLSIRTAYILVAIWQFIFVIGYL
jgi:hypothetical protein